MGLNEQIQDLRRDVDHLGDKVGELEDDLASLTNTVEELKSLVTPLSERHGK